MHEAFYVWLYLFLDIYWVTNKNKINFIVKIKIQNFKLLVLFKILINCRPTSTVLKQKLAAHDKKEVLSSNFFIYS